MSRSMAMILVAGWLTTSASAQGFEIDMSQAELRELGTLVFADELAVNDIAYFWPTQLCISDGQLFIPSTENTRSADETHSFILAATMLPGKRFSVETRVPSKPGEFGRSDVTGLIANLADPFSFFEAPWSCARHEAESRWPVEFYQIIDIDGHTNLSALHEDLMSREFAFDDPDDQ